ncbi:hypothetical protein PFISCL1PPCAC_13088, partial [Pristionchus fissidentatus]
MTYITLFSKSNTRILICCYWFISTASNFYMLHFVDCAFLLPQDTWIFIFKDTTVCNKVEWYADFIKYVVFVIIVAVLDGSSIMQLQYMNRKQSGVQDVISARRRRRQMNLVYQVSLQGIFFISELITYFLLSPYARNKWEAFLLTSVSWCLVHGMDGFIALTCNRDCRRQLTSAIKPKTSFVRTT